MYRTAVTLTLLSLATAFASSACSSGNIPVGASQSQSALQKKKDGTPTGNGTTCSWDDSVSSDGTTTPSPGGQYKPGDTFKASDGCNECTCTGEGIACTLSDCAPSCSEEAKQCPDGSYVGRSGPRCELAACPGDVACTEEAKQCPDGSHVGRSGPTCAFAPCPAH